MVLGKRGYGGAEGPGAGRVVGYVEEEGLGSVAGGSGKSEGFEAAGPDGVADALFYGFGGDF